MYITRDEDIRYVILLSVIPGKEMSEELIRAHVGHLKELDRQGKLVLCGPFTDYRGGMVIIKAAGYEEAKAVAEADPYVQAGVESYELRTWELSCEGNNHMGMG
ncbi:YciI family protein [Paenibacillus sp. M1]|uniref:YciI family protein n=1 Tax=Paenibacillus haidiansis TaxID=1574488 RepID=A0ABU7VWA1_9BACL